MPSRQGLSASIILLLTACDLGSVAARLPVIADRPAAFRSSNPVMALNAAITQAGGRVESAIAVQCQVSVQLTPTRFGPEATIQAQQTIGNDWTCRLPAAFRATVRPNMNLRFRWQAFSGNSERRTKVAETEYRDTLLDCPTSLAETLRGEQTDVIARFSGLSTFQLLEHNGWAPSHGFASLAGLGVAFVKASDAAAAVSLAEAGAPRAGNPNLLLLFPLPGKPVTDVAGDDGPYTLIGWAYAKPIGSLSAIPRPPDGRPDADDGRRREPRPVLPCIPHHEWMIHAEGVHLPDGGFHTGRGDVVRNGPLGQTREDVPGIPHTAIWDLHLWRGREGEAATISILNPRQTPGLAAPSNAFFYPTAYD